VQQLCHADCPRTGKECLNTPIPCYLAAAPNNDEAANAAGEPRLNNESYLRREINMQIDRRGVLRRAALNGAMNGLIFIVMPSAFAGPCTTQIATLDQQIKIAASNPNVGPSGTQTVGAQLHRQPTPNTVEHAEVRANADADAALARARKADAAGDAPGCQSALMEARRLYGLEK
jgi:hypothetical protein